MLALLFDIFKHLNFLVCLAALHFLDHLYLQSFDLAPEGSDFRALEVVPELSKHPVLLKALRKAPLVNRFEENVLHVVGKSVLEVQKLNVDRLFKQVSNHVP